MKSFGEIAQLSTGATLHLTPEERGAFGKLDYKETRLSYRTHRNVVVLRSGICLKGGLILQGSMYKIPRRYPGHTLLAYGSRLRRPLTPANPRKTYVVIHSPWSGGYYHWITESLARLQPVHHLLEQATVLLPSNTNLNEVMVRSLECFGVGDIEFFPPESNVFVQNLILPAIPPRHREVSRESMDFIRAHVVNAIGPGSPASRTPKRLFISRERSRGRKIVNEDQVAAFLESRGFARVFAEELGFVDQVRLMQGADIVVSQHGAGLTNLIFMPPGGTVLELFRRPPGFDGHGLGLLSAKLGPTYPRLASKAGMHYYCLLCEAADPRQGSWLGDIVVDVSRLEEKLRLIEARR